MGSRGDFTEYHWDLERVALKEGEDEKEKIETMVQKVYPTHSPAFRFYLQGWRFAAYKQDVNLMHLGGPNSEQRKINTGECSKSGELLWRVEWYFDSANF